MQAGVSLVKVSKLLGHSSVTTTEIYAHLAPNEVSEEAVMVLGICLRRYPISLVSWNVVLQGLTPPTTVPPCDD
ncbi:MAG: hypothetical protein ACRD8U_01935 [Pyrinomonadaceae bacterium]